LRDNRFALDSENVNIALTGGLLAHQAKGSPFLSEISFIHFGERDAPGHPTRDRSLNNLGLRASADPRPGHVDGGVEGIYQWGHVSASTAANAAMLTASATFVRAHLGYSWAGKWKPHVLAEFDRASGDGTSGTYGRFDTLFGFRRGDLAPSGLYNAIGRANILSPGLRIEVTPAPAWMRLSAGAACGWPTAMTVFRPPTCAMRPGAAAISPGISSIRGCAIG